MDFIQYYYPPPQKKSSIIVKQLSLYMYLDTVIKANIRYLQKFLPFFINGDKLPLINTKKNHPKYKNCFLLLYQILIINYNNVKFKLKKRFQLTVAIGKDEKPDTQKHLIHLCDEAGHQGMEEITHDSRILFIISRRQKNTIG